MITQSQGYQFARTAGLSKDRAILASAIMMAESGGDEQQITKDDDDLSYGLWQINMLGSMGPTRRALYGLASNDVLLDPAENARIMAWISHQGTSFDAWGAYTNGSYKDFMPPKVPDPSIARYTAAPVEDTSWWDGITKIGSALDKATGWVSNQQNWVRVLYVIGGGILVFVGIQTVITPYVAPVAKKAAGMVMPAAKLATKAGKRIAS